MSGYTKAEEYTNTLVKRLRSLYGEYIAELEIIIRGLGDSTVEVLETFLSIEQHRFQQISSVEKVLNTHLQGCSPSFQSGASEVLRSLRMDALMKSRELRSSLKIRMARIKTELSSIRVPGRAKNYRQESVPVLIDIER
ncbi:hypothetical protein [Spirochaeta isovalerica]|uniref:Uncharacterized protein n=1 Tax=Spirochaeta isovalerica TaxID=150 RepID=A0A841R8G5_9SPIO|nr:hypothetical protein [Spirochaeta isovalerica]MBB6481574.1 hypothetical protein [Spirochaeta isovalerica]